MFELLLNMEVNLGITVVKVVGENKSRWRWSIHYCCCCCWSFSRSLNLMNDLNVHGAQRITSLFIISSQSRSHELYTPWTTTWAQHDQSYVSQTWTPKLQDSSGCGGKLASAPATCCPSATSSPGKTSNDVNIYDNVSACFIEQYSNNG